MASWKLPGVFSPRYIGCTSNHNTRNSRHGRCGACPMRSPAHSRNSTRFPNSKPRRSWGLSSLNFPRNPTVSPFVIWLIADGEPASLGGLIQNEQRRMNISLYGCEYLLAVPSVRQGREHNVRYGQE